MSAHLSNDVIEQFHRRALTGGDRGEIYNHILRCETCRQRVVTPQIEAVALRTLTGHLLPTEDEEPFHLELETIEAFVDDTLDPLDRSTVKLHLEDCAQCAAEASDLRESLATMKAASRRPSERRPSERRSSRSLKFSTPIRIAAMVALIAFAAVALIAVFKWRSSSLGIITGSQPTPVASPQAPALTPSPSTGPNPPKLAQNPPTKEPNEQPRNVIALKDGPNEIALDQGGNVVGLSSLPPEMRQAVKHALTGESLNRPDVLDEIASAQVSVRAPTGDEERVRLAYPTNSVIPENQPTLHWIPSKTARAYRVEIADETFHQVARSEDLPATSQSWTSSAPLQRGGIYTWTIRTVSKGGEPSSLTSQAKFKVLGEDKVRELNRLKAGSQSHLVLGLFYAHEGMTAEAEREFQILAKENPRSQVARQLLENLRSWQRR
jgi:Putative zinc-finger